MCAKPKVRRALGALWNDGQGWILVMVSLGWALTLGARVVYPALLPYVRVEFQFGYTSVGILISILWVTYGVMQFPGGLFADITTERSALVAGMVGAGVGVVALISSSNLWVFSFGTVVLGIGAGLYGPSRVTVLSNAYHRNDSTAIGISQAAGNFGNATLPILAGAVSAVVGWRIGFGTLLPLLVPVAIGLWIVIPTRRPSDETVAIYDLLKRTPDSIVRPSVYCGTGLLLCVMFVYQSLTGFLPTFLIDGKGVSASIAVVLFGGFFFSAMIVQVIAGLIADRYGPRVTIGAFAALSLPGVGTLLVVDGLAALIGGVVLLSCLLGCFPPAHSYTVDAIPVDVQGTGYGLLRTVYIGVGAAGPVVTGVLVDRISFDAAFLLLMGIIAFIVWLSRSIPGLGNSS